MSEKFRKKPVTIEALRWTGENTDEMSAFCPGVMFGADRTAGRLSTRRDRGAPMSDTTEREALGQHLHERSMARLAALVQDVVAPIVAPYVSGPMDSLDVEIARAVLALLPGPTVAQVQRETREQVAREIEAAVKDEGHWRSTCDDYREAGWDGDPDDYERMFWDAALNRAARIARADEVVDPSDDGA